MYFLNWASMMYDVSLANGTTLTQCMFALTGVPPDQLSL